MLRKQMRLSTVLKPYLPKSLLGRAVLIIVTPLVLLQLVTTVIFFENHWSKVSRRLAQGVAGDIALIIEQMPKYQQTDELQDLYRRAQTNFQLTFKYYPGEVIANSNKQSGLMETSLTRALENHIKKPFSLNSESDRFVIVHIQLGQGVLEI
ncbi:MAG: hypothetical protein KAQ66_07460, partial [Rhodospirillaceae bacterium]|nr:hypothetical protein [Rhodospirillaceae bacterium]